MPEKNEEKKNEEFRLMDHQLVPKHEIMEDEEKAKVLEEFNISEKQVPLILQSDPIIKEMGAKAGQMIKITRESRIAGTTTYYRIVSK